MWRRSGRGGATARGQANPILSRSRDSPVYAGYPHTVELTQALDTIFATNHRAHWAAQLDAHGIIWAPVAKLTDVIDDPQAREMGWLTTIEHPELGTLETVSTPFRIYGADVGPRGPAPAAGAHTFEVLAELNIGDEEIAQLAADGVIG